MFSKNNDDDKRLSSSLAANIIKTQDELLGFRIALQRPLEIIQHFPLSMDRHLDDGTSVASFFDEREHIAASLELLISDILKLKVFSNGVSLKL